MLNSGAAQRLASRELQDALHAAERGLQQQERILLGAAKRTFRCDAAEGRKDGRGHGEVRRGRSDGTDPSGGPTQEGLRLGRAGARPQRGEHQRGKPNRGNLQSAQHHSPDQLSLQPGEVGTANLLLLMISGVPFVAARCHRSPDEPSRRDQAWGQRFFTRHAPHPRRRRPRQPAGCPHGPLGRPATADPAGITASGGADPLPAQATALSGLRFTTPWRSPPSRSPHLPASSAARSRRSAQL
jgi:hypothetical protein